MKRSRRNSCQRLNQSSSTAEDERKYWRLLWRKARRTTINLPGKKWCDYWHMHFDMEGRGQRSRFEHRKHIRPLMLAFARAKSELAHQATPYQIFACIDPSDPGSNALFVHTPNPQTDFPAVFEEYEFTATCPPLLMGLIDIRQYQIGFLTRQGKTHYLVVAR